MANSIPLGMLNTQSAIESASMDGRATEMLNCMVRDNALRNRPGTAKFALTGPASAVQCWHRYVATSGSEYDIIKARGGRLFWAVAGNGSFTALGSATGTGDTYGSFFQRDAYLYYTSAAKNVCIWKAAGTWHSRSMGADVPTVAPTTAAQASGGLYPGKYVYALSAYDEKARVWGLRSPYGTDYAALDADNQGVVVSWSASNYTVGGVSASQVILWRAPAELVNGNLVTVEPFRMVSAGTNTATYGDLIPDALLGDEYANVGAKPPYTDLSCYHNDRAYFLSGSSLWFSDKGRPEMIFQTDTRTYMIGKGDPQPYGESKLHVPGHGTGLVSFAGRLLVFTSDNVYVMLGDGFGGQILPTGWGHGCCFHKSIVATRHGLFWMSADGVCWSDGTHCRLLTEGTIDFDTSGVSTAITRSAMNGTYPAIGAYDSLTECYVVSLAPATGSGSWLLSYDCNRRGFFRQTFGFHGGAASITALNELKSTTALPSMVVCSSSPTAYRFSDALAADDGTAFTVRWTGWTGQADIGRDKAWGDPRIAFSSGCSGTATLSLVAAQEGLVADGNTAGSHTILTTDTGPQTIPTGYQVGRLMRLDFLKATAGKVAITELYVDRQLVGEPISQEVDKA